MLRPNTDLPDATHDPPDQVWHACRKDTVIRADGGAGLPPLNMAQLAEPDQDPVRPLLLIDFIDRHHRQLCQDSRRRQEAYAESGWFAVGVDPVQGRIDHFLATRP